MKGVVRFVVKLGILLLPLCSVSAQILQEDVPILFATAEEARADSSISRVAGMAASSSATNYSQFTRYFRYQVESPVGYVTMNEVDDESGGGLLPTAYYRDAFAGVETLLSVDETITSKVWKMRLVYPDNSHDVFTVSYSTSYGGTTGCFYASQTRCGINRLRLYWQIPARCKMPGNYQMTFFEDGVEFDSRRFRISARVNPDRIPVYNQDAYPDVEMGGVPFFKPTIQAQGCMLTSLAMILAYHGISGSDGQPITPDGLNQRLLDLGGYTLRSQIIWETFSQISAGAVKLDRGLSYANLSENICNYGPQPVGAAGSVGIPNTHWMVASGLNADDRYLVIDPKSGRDHYYGESWSPSDSTRGIVGPEKTVTDVDGISIYLHSPAELLLTDPDGRRLGVDPITGQSFKEIPSSMYDLEGAGDQEPSKLLAFSGLIAGEYSLDVIGTGNGHYDLEIHAMDKSFNSSSAMVLDVPVTPGIRHNYRFNFSGQPGTRLEFLGSFLGGGQSESANKLLTYTAPVQRETKLPVGTAVYGLSVFYNKAIASGSFSAELNGIDVANLFHPVAGTNERVNIPVRAGRNRLILAVKGELDGRVVSDKDQLVFILP